ncbi:isochorismate synthase [Jeotgalibacillus haloalkalitolerans]|uniref:isochorismate synthase n=1 Tax=Jeotgalibacillus haloalkalitolerans TaxID=3104292 RepID=A0ABU5KMT1_9BACL|nr:isochorismate synthase [Jeotgalibacillus sp. HH7-29]MDZ5712563.1 isochorismate synthase [Jeotgalibacillus sp. HH7-29]
MRILHQSQGFTTFEQAYERAEKSNQPVLYSKTMEIEPIDPLQFYEAGYSIFNGRRSFWQDPKSELIFAGAGSAKTFHMKDQNRFDSLSDQWKTFLKNAVIEKGDAWTGPVILGGFSFDPKKPKSAEWSSFEQGYFQLPAFMLTVDQYGKTYLTMNVECKKGDHAVNVWNQMQKQKTALLNKSDSSLKDVNVLSIKEFEPEQWKSSLSSVVDRINRTELEKVVLARKVKVSFNDKKRSDSVLEKLRDDQSESFIFSFESGESCFIGATPERLIKKYQNKVLSTCLAGSIARGKTVEEDQQFGNELLHDEKNLGEHEIVVRMISKSLEDLCSELTVPDQPVLMKMRDIQHLYTPVEGMTDKASILEFVKELHPTPALGGTPTVKAMQIIREEEEMDRGFYAAPVGWLNAEGDGEFAVAIRSGLLSGEHAYLYAGCGVVKDSDAESEYQETLIKLRPMVRAVGGTIS